MVMGPDMAEQAVTSASQTPAPPQDFSLTQILSEERVFSSVTS